MELSRLVHQEGVAFLSHQWASFEHPDPDGVQYRTLSSGFWALGAVVPKSLYHTYRLAYIYIYVYVCMRCIYVTYIHICM